MTSISSFKEEATTIKSQIVKAIYERLIAAYEAANDEDRAQVADLVERAKNGKRASMIFKIRPGAAAILFFDHNRQNREWRPLVSEDYREQIERDEFEFNNQGIGFLVNGNLGDGQHRLVGIALAGKTVEINVVFGLAEGSIITIDINHRRQAADFLSIGGQIADAKRKQSMVKQAYSLMRALAKDDEEKARPYILRVGNRDIAKAIVDHDQLLNDAISIGDQSVEGRSSPTFNKSEAATLAFCLMLQGNWSKVKIAADLDEFQTGQDREGGNSPMFTTASLLQRTGRGDKLSTIKRLAAACHAFVLHEKGIKAVRPNDIKTAIKKMEIDASYPGGSNVTSLRDGSVG
jgi:hypothetical protein